MLGACFVAAVLNGFEGTLHEASSARFPWHDENATG